MMMTGFVSLFLFSALQIQGVAGKKGVMLVFDAFEPAGIQEVGLLFLPSRGKSSGDPLARKVCTLSGKTSPICARAHTVRVKRFPLPPARLQDTVMWVMRDGWKRGAGEVGLWIRGVDGTVEVGWLKEGVGLQVVGDTFRWPFAGYDPGQSYTYPWGVYPDVNVQWFKFWTWGHLFVTEVKSAVSDGRLYMANGGEVLEVMDVETGEVVDSVEMVSNVNAAVLIGDSLLVVASTFGTLEPEKDTTLKLFRLPDLELVWGMTGLETVQSVMVVGDTIVTGGWGRVCAITREGKIVREWPLYGAIQVPVLVADTVLVGWGEGELVAYRWPYSDTLWRVGPLEGGGWLRAFPDDPEHVWVMDRLYLLRIHVRTGDVQNLPFNSYGDPGVMLWRDTLFVAGYFWVWNSHLIGSTLEVRIPEGDTWRLESKRYLYLEKGGGGYPARSGEITKGSIWMLSQWGFVVDPQTFVVHRLGNMPGNWEEWEYYVPPSMFYPLLYHNFVIHANRMGRFVLRGQSQPPPGWGEVERPVRLVVLPRRVRVEHMPETWEGASFWLQDMLGRRVFSGTVRGRVLEVGPLKPGVYRLRIGNTWIRKVVIF